MFFSSLTLLTHLYSQESRTNTLGTSELGTTIRYGRTPWARTYMKKNRNFSADPLFSLHLTHQEVSDRRQFYIFHNTSVIFTRTLNLNWFVCHTNSIHVASLQSLPLACTVLRLKLSSPRSNRTTGTALQLIPKRFWYTGLSTC